METCSNCRVPLRNGAQFCHQCGVPAEPSCARCGHHLPPGAAFCDSCGLTQPRSLATTHGSQVPAPESPTGSLAAQNAAGLAGQLAPASGTVQRLEYPPPPPAPPPPTIAAPAGVPIPHPPGANTPASQAPAWEKWPAFDFGGRLSRSQYVLPLLAYWIAAILGSWTVMEQVQSGEVWTPLVGLVFLLVLVHMQTSFVVRRLHDLNLSGKYCFLLLVPFAGLWLALRLLFEHGTRGPNNYGSDPAAR